MFKKIFFHSLIAGILASVAGLIYNRIYFFATEADFFRGLNTGSIIGLNIMVCLVAGMVFLEFGKASEEKGEVVFWFFLLSIISFGCVIIPILISMPLKVQSPELFPGLAVPMVFFPAMPWYPVKPLFTLSTTLIT